MYPYVRTAAELFKNRKAAPLALDGTHVTPILVWPWDIDPFLELNNGRILTLMDLGRFGIFQRMGFPKRLKELGWYGTVAGTAVRYRRRVTVFQRLELRTRILGWDARFIYIEHAFWRGDDCCAHAVVRTAVTSGRGIVPTDELARAFDLPEESPELPDWVRAWAAAETERVWPPEF